MCRYPGLHLHLHWLSPTSSVPSFRQTSEHVLQPGGHGPLLEAYSLSLSTALAFAARGYQAECQARVMPRGLFTAAPQPYYNVCGSQTGGLRRTRTSRRSTVRGTRNGTRA